MVTRDNKIQKNESKEFLNRFVSNNFIKLLGGLILTSLILMGLVVLGVIPEVYADLIPGITTSLLTIGLILIYWQMEENQRDTIELQKAQTNNQSDQIEIQEEQMKSQLEQTKRIKQRNSPYLVIKNLNFCYDDSNSDPPKGEKYYMEVGIKNLGDIPARNIRILIEPVLMKWEGHDKGLEEIGNTGLRNISRLARKTDNKGKESKVKDTGRNSENDKKVDVVERGAFLPPEDSGTYKMEVNFEIDDKNEEGYFSPGSKVDYLQAIRPYEMIEAATQIEADSEKDAIFKEDRNQENTFWDTGKKKSVGDVPFHRLKLNISVNYLARFGSETGSEDNPERLMSIILPLKEIGNNVESEGFDDPMWKWTSDQIWEHAMDATKYEERDLESIATQYQEFSYEKDLDPIENKIKSEDQE